MKKILTLAVAFIAVFSLVSCNDDNGRDPVFKVRPEAITFDRDAGEPQIIDVITSTDVSWKAEVEAAAQDWLTITTEADKVIVRATENATFEQRSGKITVTPGNGSFKPAEVAVSQYAVPITKIDITKAFLMFLGDYYECGLSTYYLIMGNGDARYVEDEDGSRIATDNGYVLLLNILTDDIAPQDYQRIDLRDGTYKSSIDVNDENFEFEKQSFITSFKDFGMLLGEIISMGPDGRDGSQLMYIYIENFLTSLMVRYEDGKFVERIMISEGEFTVKNDNGNYTVSADFTTPDGEKVIINYAGKPDPKLSLVSYSTYANTFNLSGLDTGTLEFHGDENSPGCHQWIVDIDVPGYDDVSELMLTLYSPTTSTTVLDGGVYNISDIYPYEPYTAEDGWGIEYGVLLGSWIIGYTGDELTDYAPLKQGTVNVTHNGGDNYTIEVDALMDNYYAVKASFEGDLEYTDTTAAPQPMPPLKMSSSKKTVPTEGIKGKTFYRLTNQTGQL